jgi:hypothetical protein
MSASRIFGGLSIFSEDYISGNVFAPGIKTKILMRLR